MFILWVFIFVAGLAVGSFINVLCDRIPKEERVISGRSHCDHCRRMLEAFELIPLVSYIMQKGKCRTCRKPISVRHPVIELITGIATVCIYCYSLSVSGSLPFQLIYFLSLYLIFISFLVIFITDYKYQIIPDSMIIASALGALLYHIADKSEGNFMNIALASIGASFLFLVLYIATKGRGIGMGDVKLVFVIGLFLGFPNVVVSLYISFLTGAFFGVILVVSKKKRLKSKIAFGPFLIIGMLVAYLWGAIAVQWWEGLII